MRESSTDLLLCGDQPNPPLPDHPSTTSQLVQRYRQNTQCCCWRRFGKRVSRRRRRRGRVFHEVSSVSEREPAPHQCRPDRPGKRRRLIMTPTWNDEERPLKGTTGYLLRTPSTQYNGQHKIPLLHRQPPSAHTIVRMCEKHSRQQQPSIASATLCISPNFTFCLFVLQMCQFCSDPLGTNCRSAFQMLLSKPVEDCTVTLNTGNKGH